jgi:hypothetical protein
VVRELSSRPLRPRVLDDLTKRAVAERPRCGRVSSMSDKQTDTALAGSVLTAFLGLVCLGIGVSMVFSAGWALIVIGGLFVLYSLIIAISRRSETLLYADKTVNRIGN